MLLWLFVWLEEAIVSVFGYIRLDLCKHAKVCVLAQANISKLVFVIASGCMALAVSLAPQSLHVVEIEDRRKKS